MRCLALLLALLGAPVFAAAPAKPNFIVIFVDNFGNGGCKPLARVYRA